MQMPQEMPLKLVARKTSIHRQHNASANTSKQLVPPQGNEALAVWQSWAIKTNVKLYEMPKEANK